MGKVSLSTGDSIHSMNEFLAKLNEVMLDKISAMVYSVRLVLAAGAAGTDTVSDCMADPNAISPRRHCRGRRAGIALGRRDPACPPPARPAAFID